MRAASWLTPGGFFERYLDRERMMDWRKNAQVAASVRLANAIESGAWMLAIGLVAVAFAIASNPFAQLGLGIMLSIMVMTLGNSKFKELEWFGFNEYKKEIPEESKDKAEE